MPPVKSENIIKAIEATHVIGERYYPIIPDKLIDALMGKEVDPEDTSCAVCGKQDGSKRKYEGKWYCISFVVSRDSKLSCFDQIFESDSAMIQIETISLVCPFCNHELGAWYKDGRLTSNFCPDCGASLTEDYNGVVNFIKPR